MPDSRDEVLGAEAFIRDAAAQLTMMQGRSAALAGAKAELENATKQLEKGIGLLHESHTRDTEARRALSNAVEGVDAQVATALNSELAGLTERIDRTVLHLQERLSEAESLRRDALDASLGEARRSLLDSAQGLSQTAAGVAANIKLLSDFSATEREQWRATLLNAVVEANTRLKETGDSAVAATRDIRDAAIKSIDRLTPAVSALTNGAAEVQAVATRIQRENKPSALDELRAEVKSLQKSVVLVAAIQMLILLGVVAALFVAWRRYLPRR